MDESCYTHFDNALLGHIRHGRGNFQQLCQKNMGLLEMAEPLRTSDPWRGRTPAREVIEQRLQALKNIGMIVFDGLKWKTT